MSNRDKILKGYMYSIVSGPTLVAMTGWKGAQEFYDRMLKMGFTDIQAGEAISVDVAVPGTRTIWRTLHSLTVLKAEDNGI